MTKNFWVFISGFVTICLAVFFLTTQSTPAVNLTSSYDWQFTNESGSAGSPTDLIRGEVIFEHDGSLPFPKEIRPTSFRITSITGLNSSSRPFFGDGEIELNTNLVNVGFGNIFVAEFDPEGRLQSLLVNFSETDEFFYLSFNHNLLPPEVSFEDATLGNSYKDRDASSFFITKQITKVP